MVKRIIKWLKDVDSTPAYLPANPAAKIAKKNLSPITSRRKDDLIALIQSELKKQREDIRKQLPEKKVQEGETYNMLVQPTLDAYNQAIQDITKILDSYEESK